MATARKLSAEEQRKLLAELEVPFDPAMVKWKVVRRAHSGRRGAVLPFADPRAYTDRLNQVLTPAGWGRTYTLSTLSNLTRRLWDGKLISTGKVLVTSTVSVHRLGSHVGNGERGPIESTRSPQPKPRPSSERAPALVWAGICTASGKCGFP